MPYTDPSLEPVLTRKEHQHLHDFWARLRVENPTLYAQMRREDQAEMINGYLTRMQRRQCDPCHGGCGQWWFTPISPREMPSFSCPHCRNGQPRR